MEQNDENNKKLVVTNIKDILDIETSYGYWQTYLFNDERQEYEPIYKEFIFYKGRFFDNLETAPWNEDAVEKVKMLSNYFNRNGDPICIFRQEHKL